MTYKRVPYEPTPEMLTAYKKALSRHIDKTFGPQQRLDAKGLYKGLHVPERVKARVRYQAMLDFAPPPEANSGLTNREHCSRLAELIRNMYIDTPHGRVHTQAEAVKAFNYFVQHADSILAEIQTNVE